MGDAYEVRQGDCLDLMHKMPIASVDAVIADPPYMINTKSDGMGKLDPWADYMNAAYWYAELLRAIRRVLSPNGAAWVFMNWRGLTTLNKASCEARWPIGSVLTWAKDWPGTGNLLRSSSELVCLFVGDDFKMPRHDLLDVQTFKPVPTAQRVHPAQKPTELLRFLIEAVCPGGYRLGPICRIRLDRRGMRGDGPAFRRHGNDRPLPRGRKPASCRVVRPAEA